MVLDAGLVRQFGAPLELYQHPRNKFVAGFIGSPKMNFLPIAVDGRSLRLPTAPPSPSSPTAAPSPRTRHPPRAPRPDGSGDAAIEGEVITIERLGAESYMYVDIGQEEPLVVKAERRCRCGTGNGRGSGYRRRRRTCSRLMGAASSGRRPLRVASAGRQELARCLT